MGADLLPLPSPSPDSPPLPSPRARSAQVNHRIHMISALPLRRQALQRFCNLITLNFPCFMPSQAHDPTLGSRRPADR